MARRPFFEFRRYELMHDHFQCLHSQCLDMVAVEWADSTGNRSSESAIVLEIWEGGALLNTSATVVPGSELTIRAPKNTFTGHVVKCSRDLDFGFLVEVDAVPSSYRPAWTLPVQPVVAGLEYYC